MQCSRAYPCQPFHEILPTWEALTDKEIIENFNDHSDPFNSYNIHLDFLQYTYLKKFLYSSKELSKVEAEMKVLYKQVVYIDEFLSLRSVMMKKKMANLKTSRRSKKTAAKISAVI